MALEALQRAGIAPKLAAYGANWSRKTASCRRLVGTRIIGSPDCIAGLAQYSVGRIHCFFCGGRRNGGVEVRWFCRGRVDPESCLPPNIYKEKTAWQEEGTQGPKLTLLRYEKAWIAPCKSAQASALGAAVSDRVA
jgi:hypothetical protein